MEFACMHNHRVSATDAEGKPVDLEGFFCPVCMGGIIGAGKMIDARILAPVQEAKR
jgi:hypothetical protein